MSAYTFVAITSREMSPSASSAAACPASSSSSVAGRLATRRRRATSQLAAASSTNAIRAARGHVPAALDAGSGGTAAPSGKAPNSANSSNRTPSQSQNPSRRRYARKAGPSGTWRRRQRANRSTAATANGTTSAIRTSASAQPSTIRPAKYT